MNMLILCFKETFCGTSPNQSFLSCTRLKMLFAAVPEKGRRNSGGQMEGAAHNSHWGRLRNPQTYQPMNAE
jgi:hypothetical protein